MFDKIIHDCMKTRTIIDNGVIIKEEFEAKVFNTLDWLEINVYRTTYGTTDKVCSITLKDDFTGWIEAARGYKLTAYLHEIMTFLDQTAVYKLSFDLVTGSIIYDDGNNLDIFEMIDIRYR